LLDALAQRGIGRLYTLKAIVELGGGWIDCKKVATHIWTEYKYGTNHIYEMGVRYPLLIELSADKKQVRIPDGVYKLVAANVDEYLRSAKLHARKVAK
jgi:hypothetical protein